MLLNKDVAVPFMRNICWEDDTLFLIFEEDFRFEPENEDVEPSFVPASQFQEVPGQFVFEAESGGTAVTRSLRVAQPSVYSCVSLHVFDCRVIFEFG